MPLPSASSENTIPDTIYDREYALGISCDDQPICGLSNLSRRFYFLLLTSSAPLIFTAVIMASYPDIPDARGGVRVPAFQATDVLRKLSSHCT